MGQAYGQSGQGGKVTIGTVGPLRCTRIKLRKTYNNADTTVTDNGWGKLCPVYRDWIVDVEMPSRTADALFCRFTHEKKSLLQFDNAF